MHFASGSKLYRQDISVSLNGEGSEANLNGLCLSNEMQHLDHFVTMDHDQPQCVSRQLFKYILSDSSSGAFNGRIVVSPDSQKTDAIQTNKNLLLSESALMNSNPQLEIYANDVKCAHGSTSGQMDPEAIFYLQSRGLNKNEARLLLINGFAREVIQNIQDKATQEYLDNLLNDWLDKQKNKM
jgi:Fe-S cluster assembly protein SufD